MNTQDLIEKLKQYPFASVSLAVSIFLILAIYVRGMAMPDQRDRQEQAAETWSEMEENVFKNSVNLETHLEKAKASSQDVKERLIRSSQLATNYQYFYRHEADTGVKIMSLQQQPLAAPPKSKKEREEAPMFSKVGYKMTVAGTFDQTLQFLHSLEHGQHFYRLNSAAVQKEKDAERAGQNITLTLTFDLLGTP